MFVVIYFEDWVGYHFDENTRYFTSYASALKYCNKLNQELLKEYDCKVEELGDRYEIEEIKKGK